MKSDYNQKTEGYFAEARPEIQQYVRNGINSLLDVGCGAGEMASQLKKNKGIKDVWGIELVESAGRKAENVLDRVIISPVEQAIDKLPDGYFDTIIFADVLEHLVEPEEVLKRIKTKLKQGGEIIASIPNVRHWSIIKQLLEGEWKYEDYGLMDRTHLRFFTKKSAIRLFDSVGFQTTLLASKVLANRVEISDGIISKLKENQIDASTLKEEINDFQYLIKAKKLIAEIAVDINMLHKGFIEKFNLLPEEIRNSIKIIFLYEIENELTEFIKEQGKTNNLITIKNINEFGLSEGVIKINQSNLHSLLEILQ